MSGPIVRLVAGHPVGWPEGVYADCSDGARYRLELDFNQARRWAEYGTL